MNSPAQLPKVGGRVQIEGRDETFVIVEVDEETQTVSVIPESEVFRRSLDELTPAHPLRSDD
ncbi:hypothetical protein [Occallatibacter riparius]|uniref:Uncharacterized protein n=1 Tax=Occallatibacter riparius TaxID=1002689 RepID=A0A9J7BSL1_9BACT|nr:hypothetical protein [Occallatibacter riparius]UWZ85648.1 hypothetical protein MOP44_06810 [Occallatibacter riparius]